MARRPVCSGPVDRTCGFQVRAAASGIVVLGFGGQAAFLSQDFFAHGDQTYILLNTWREVRSLGQVSACSVRSRSGS